MRRLVQVAVVAAMVLAAIPVGPAQGARPSTTFTMLTINCPIPPDDDLRMWLAGRTWHARDASAFGVNYTLTGDAWVESGTTWNHVQKAVWSPGTFVDSGTFEIRDVQGDFDGVFYLNAGRVWAAIGHGVGESTGLHIRIVFADGYPAGLPPMPGDPCHGSPPLEGEFGVATVTID